MRLFTAIEFPAQVRELLKTDAERVREYFGYGRFVRDETYHLTVVFLGERDGGELKRIIAAADKCAAFPRMEISVRELGRFKRDGGDVFWRRVAAPRALFELRRTLESALAAEGIRTESRAFKPHLTLARDAGLKEGVTLEKASEALSEISFTADKLTLFRSDIIGGKRVYTPLHATPFVKG